MPSPASHSGDLPQDSGADPVHRSPVTRNAATLSSVSGAARKGRLFYHTLSASSVGLELGLSVVVGILFGRWLDGRFGTAPWLMLAFFALGLVAGFRSVMRAVRRADRVAAAEAAETVEARHG
jgi:ATP synthase protein I